MVRYRQIPPPHEIELGYFIANYYDDGHVNGWGGESLAKEAFYLLAQEPNSGFVSIAHLPVQGNGKAMLYQFTRKVLGKDTQNYPQQIGDCVSFGAKNAIEYLICVQNILGVAPDVFKPVYPPYLYGCGRVFIGRGRIPANKDGSVGAWQAKAVQLYGAISSEEEGLQPYSGSVAKQWGSQGPPEKYVSIGKTHPVKSAALISSWQDMVTAVTNGYPCTIASNQGFKVQPDSDGFHSPGPKPWGHQMSIIGVDNAYREPYGLILNSWGDTHGHLKDFETEEELPVGVLRARADVIEKMIRQGDTFAYSHLEWFQAQRLPQELFKLI